MTKTLKDLGVEHPFHLLNKLNIIKATCPSHFGLSHKKCEEWDNECDNCWDCWTLALEDECDRLDD